MKLNLFDRVVLGLAMLFLGMIALRPLRRIVRPGGGRCQADGESASFPHGWRNWLHLQETNG